MKRKNKLIMLLLCIGVILTVVMTVIGDRAEQREKAYARAQFDATTSDISFITPYKNPYMGNASNIINLFYHLPLSGNDMKFHLLSEKLTLQVTYECTMQEAGKTNLENISGDMKRVKDMTDNDCTTEVKKSLIYNSTTAFALIGNLNYVEYVFSDVSYQVSRADVESIYTDFRDIREPNHWKKQVQQPLEQSDYINDIAKQILKVQ
jgi:hypothetical protein